MMRRPPLIRSTSAAIGASSGGPKFRTQDSFVVGVTSTTSKTSTTRARTGPEIVVAAPRRLVEARPTNYHARVSKRSRVLAALRGDPVDRVPVSFWGHHYVAENSAEGLALETLRWARQFDWDYLKPQSRAQAFAEMWGLTYTPSRIPSEKYSATHFPLDGAAALARLKPADPSGGALGEQIEALRQIRAGVGPDVPIIWTVFAPLMVASFLLPGGAAQVLEIARADAAALGVGLDAITETLVGYVATCLANGADGIFYATNLTNAELLTVDECARFQRPYDLRIVESAAGADFNVMHVCGAHALFDAFADYPVTAFSWAVGDGNPSLAEGHRRTGKACMGGVPRNLAALGTYEVAELARRAAREMDGRWLLLGPDCSIDINTPADRLFAARDALRR
jgi:uroporphyrinogen decarboxylase